MSVAKNWEQFTSKIWNLVGGVRTSLIATADEPRFMLETAPLQSHCTKIQQLIRHPELRAQLPTSIKVFVMLLPKTLNLSFFSTWVEQRDDIIKDWEVICPLLRRLFAPVWTVGQGCGSSVSGSGIHTIKQGINDRSHLEAGGGVHVHAESAQSGTASISQSLISVEDGAFNEVPAFDTAQKIRWYSNKWVAVMSGVVIILSYLNRRRTGRSDETLRSLLTNLHCTMECLHKSMTGATAKNGWTSLTKSAQDTVRKLDDVFEEQHDQEMFETWKTIKGAWSETLGGYPGSRNRSYLAAVETSLYPSSEADQSFRNTSRFANSARSKDTSQGAPQMDARTDAGISRAASSDLERSGFTASHAPNFTDDLTGYLAGVPQC